MSRFFGRCNLCSGVVIRWSPDVFGNRCVRCLSTQIHRAMGLAVDTLCLPGDARVYELSSRGALFRHLRRRFRDFHFSEYFDDVLPGGIRNGVPCQDVQDLRLPSEMFDLVTSTEVFEHVPDDAKGFSEIHRVLKPGGWLVFTVPLTRNPVTVERCPPTFGRPGGAPSPPGIPFGPAPRERKGSGVPELRKGHRGSVTRCGPGTGGPNSRLRSVHGLPNVRPVRKEI